jgi:hypothetical protein
MKSLSKAWLGAAIVLAGVRRSQADGKLEYSLVYIARSCPKQIKQKHRKRKVKAQSQYIEK